MFLILLLQEVPHELRLVNRDPQNPDPLLTQWQSPLDTPEGTVPRKVGSRRVGPEGWGPKGGAPKGAGPKISLFFPLPPLFSFLPLLGVVPWNFGGVFEGRDPNVHVWSSRTVV